MSSDALLSCDHADGVTTIMLHDGRANVMSLDMLRALADALAAAQDARAAVVLAARGKAFSGGFDLATFQRRGPELVQMLEAGAGLAARLLAFPRPVVAACQGHAVAMGAFLLLAADARLAQAEGQGLRRKGGVVALAGEALLLRSTHKAAVLNERRGAVVIEGRDAEHPHGTGPTGLEERVDERGERRTLCHDEDEAEHEQQGDDGKEPPFAGTEKVGGELA